MDATKEILAKIDKIKKEKHLDEGGDTAAKKRKARRR